MLREFESMDVAFSGGSTCLAFDKGELITALKKKKLSQKCSPVISALDGWRQRELDLKFSLSCIRSSRHSSLYPTPQIIIIIF